VLARNWRCPSGEIDLIVEGAGVVVVVEVKARASDAYGGALAAVGRVKQRRLRALAATWLDERGEHWPEVRFDVVAVTGVQVEVIEAAF
jgi:putative endonuclease